MSMHISVKNVGGAALKIKRLFVVVQRKDGHVFAAQYEVQLEDYTNRVLAPNAGFSEDANIEVRSKEDHDALLGIHVDCTNLSELRLHSFYWHPTHGTRHSAATPSLDKAVSVSRRAVRLMPVVCTSLRTRGSS